MGTETTGVRLARLEGAYEQIDRRLGTIEGRLAVLEGKVDAGFARLDAKIGGKIDALASELREAIVRTNARMDALGARLNTAMFGIVAAVLVPILLRLFWP
ncbi:MAG: hypothetical protein QN152_08525 [Armatimonadota bacterium]|nr:hypothetical protein [Armatimonadota bacterium]MDR7463763.1 hypothetical protein [Armatimonadota bacterium]MDR7470349.1 hypothetical protein [Armatimonadota bacterium]MDR7475231.1 hypothetical protein [Armatimonadota bacterium]MDR7539555.1 hypothetical protein [Armatimonadota bacterium]